MSLESKVNIHFGRYAEIISNNVKYVFSSGIVLVFYVIIGVKQLVIFFSANIHELRDLLNCLNI